MEKNTPELWDSLWKNTSELEDNYNLKKEEKGLRWKRIERLVLKRFNSFKNLKVIEVGAGGGTNALLFAKRGAKITILDYSKKAIERSKEFFKRNNCQAEFILSDALNLPESILHNYDVSMSFGLAEHFWGKERLQIIKSHFDLINTRGISIVSVPNKLNPPYRLFMLLSKTLGMWKFGEEYPYSISEFSQICKHLKIKNFQFFGDSFWNSFRFLNLLRLFKKKNFNIIKEEKPSIFDKKFSYSLVLVASN
jgi:2-polyprenyl-3-methyl-5-hydroxy-6-metoxy-1,4-benzoquinol methylase